MTDWLTNRQTDKVIVDICMAFFSNDLIKNYQQEIDTKIRNKNN